MTISTWVLVLALLSVIKTSQILSEDSIALTVYNEDFGMVRDTRVIQFDQGESSLYFTDVAETIQTQTVMFKPHKGQISVYEQNFENNLADKYGLLKKYLEKEISIEVQNGTVTNKVEGKLLAYSPAFLIERSEGVSIYDNAASVHIGQLPDDVVIRPTLVWKVHSSEKTEAKCTVTYRATGFSWKADYIMVLSHNEESVDFSGWVTIDNKSGKKYTNAKLKLIAGQVNTVDHYNSHRYGYQNAKMMMMDTSSGPSFGEKSFGDYHMYTLQRTVSVNDSSQKQIEFIPTTFQIGIERYYTFEVNHGGYQEEHIKVRSELKFQNSKQNRLGLPLPKGIIRVFKADSDEALEFIGEDQINHTPKDEHLTIKTGNAFDIVAKKIIKEHKSFSDGGYDATVTLEIANRGESEKEIRIQYNTPGDRHKIIDKEKDISKKWVKENAFKHGMKLRLKKGEVQTVQWQQNYR